jgi:hypothetical protein
VGSGGVGVRARGYSEGGGEREGGGEGRGEGKARQRGPCVGGGEAAGAVCWWWRGSGGRVLVVAHVLATRPCSSSQNAAGSKPATSRCNSASVALSVRLLPLAPAWWWNARLVVRARARVKARARGSVGRRGCCRARRQGGRRCARRRRCER